jgi:hypothetical protein
VAQVRVLQKRSRKNFGAAGRSRSKRTEGEAFEGDSDDSPPQPLHSPLRKHSKPPGSSADVAVQAASSQAPSEEGGVSRE